MTRGLGIIFLALMTALLSTAGVAFEIFSVLQKDCKLSTGAIIQVDDEHVVLLNIAGDQQAIDLEQIELVAQYDILNAPFHTWHREVLTPLLEVHEGGTVPPFYGYGVQFYNNLMIYLAVDGTIRVLKEAEIASIRKLGSEAIAQDFMPTPAKSPQPLHFVLPFAPPHCKMATAEEGHEKIAPTRILQDRLQIQSFFDNYRSGYRAIDSLAERAQFYQRPIMIDPVTRMGIFVHSNNLSDYMPLYWSFGSGQPYRFQSSFLIGGNAPAELPTSFPQTTLESRFKSHILHGVFLGNTLAMAAGQAVMSFDYEENPIAQAQTRRSFNHLALLGIDYAPFSLSYGYYFPVFELKFPNGHARSLLSTSASPVFSAGFWQGNLRWEGYIFVSNLSGDHLLTNSSPWDTRHEDDSMHWSGKSRPSFRGGMDSPDLDPDPDVRPMHHRISDRSLRLNMTWEPRADYLVSTSLIVGRLKYSEGNSQFGFPNDGFQAEDLAGTQSHASMEEASYSWQGMARVDLGRWVALKGLVNYDLSTLKSNFRDTPASVHRVNRTSFGAIFEILL